MSFGFIAGMCVTIPHINAEKTLAIMSKHLLSKQSVYHECNLKLSIQSENI